jgi:phytoene synthase
MNAVAQKIFKAGSKTYFNSSFFFPKKVREDVYRLYAFVRRGDDYVDEVPQDEKGFRAFCSAFRKLRSGQAVDTLDASVLSVESLDILQDFVLLEREKKFDPAWADAFLGAMEMDLAKKEYATLEETLSYIYGSAEVIGLFMAAILSLPAASHPAAQSLGRSMQYINFIRDIDEDFGLGRRYLPLEGSGLKHLSREDALKDPDAFKQFHRSQIALYRNWHKEAVKGYGYIPYKCRIAVKTAEDMYLWTARVIEKNPLIVFERKVKPSKTRIVFCALSNFIKALFYRRPS